MNCIAVVDEMWQIGKDGGLLVHLPGDLQYFKKKTLGKTIVMGRKTLESFPGQKPLPGRENLLLTANRKYNAPGCRIFHSKEELMEYLSDAKKSEDVFICGGEMIYKQFIEDCDLFYITKIYDSFDGDKSFPCLDQRQDMEITWKSEMQEEKGTAYQFFEYKRKE